MHNSTNMLNLRVYENDNKCMRISHPLLPYLLIYTVPRQRKRVKREPDVLLLLKS